MALNSNRCADVVDSTLRRYGVKGKGVRFEVFRGTGSVFVGLNTNPPDDEMTFMCARIQEQVGGRIGAVTLEGHTGFLFYEDSGPSMTDLPTRSAPRLPSPKTPKVSKPGSTKGSDSSYWKGFKKTGL